MIRLANILRTCSRMRILCPDCNGSSAAEFALLIPVLLALIFGIYEFGRVYFIQNSLQFAAEQGARYLMANPKATTSQIVSVVCGSQRASSSCGNGAAFSINVQPASQTNAACFPNAIVRTSTCVQITATYTFPNNDPLNTIVPTLVRLAARSQTAPTWNFTLQGQSTVAVS